MEDCSRKNGKPAKFYVQGALTIGHEFDKKDRFDENFAFFWQNRHLFGVKFAKVIAALPQGPRWL